MPESSKNFHLKEKVRQLPEEPGVYLMRDRLGNIIYIGKAKNLKKRVSSYFQRGRKAHFLENYRKIAGLVSMIEDLDYLTVRSEAEALILESRLIKQWKPHFNTLEKDDKQFLMIRVDIQNPLPKFRLTRNKIDQKSLYYGPFVNPQIVRKILKEMRSEFGVLLGDSTPRKIEAGLYELYNDARSEIYGHPNEVTKEAYAKRVQKACAYLEGKAKNWVKEVEEKMHKAALGKAYEKAAEYRDLLYMLKKMQEPTRKFTKNYLTQGLGETPSEKLSKLLALPKLLQRIECFDISHISGSYVVASMVCFSNGKPDKGQYRRYKIKSFIGNDDYRAMEEVVGRRYARLSKENKALPDLIVIDGGKGQVNAAMKAFLLLELSPPLIIGLAKKRETIVFADGRAPLNLPLEDPALQLLQRVRDEAHRFANSFNLAIRRKKIKESILADIEGLGAKKRSLLMDHFKSLSNLRKASEKELQAIPGIGPKLANAIYTFLKENE